MKQIALIALALALAGCANSPEVVDSGPNNVLINVADSDEGMAGAKRLADQECGKYGRYAKFMKRVSRTTLSFACIR